MVLELVGLLKLHLTMHVFLRIFRVSDQRIKKSIPRKFVIFHETKVPKKVLVCSQKKTFGIFLEMEAPKKACIFQKMKLSYISRKVYWEPIYIHNPIIFRTTSKFRTLVYSNQERYSQHCQTSKIEPFSFIIQEILSFRKTILYISRNGTFFLLTCL